MKKYCTLLLLGCLCASLAYSADSKFSLALEAWGGWSTTRTGDFGAAIQGYTSFNKSLYPGLTGGFESPSSGMAFGGELVAYLGPLGIGLGSGFARYAKDSGFSYTTGDVTSAERFQPFATLIPITLNIHYILPAFGKLRIEPWGGSGFYLTKFHWEQTTTVSLAGYQGVDVFVFDGRKSAVGFQAGVDLSYRLTSWLDVVLNIAGRFVSVSKIEGDWTETGTGDFWDFSDGGKTWAWAYDWTYQNKTYTLLAFQNDQPSGTTVSNAHSAKLSLNAFSIVLGIKVKLPV